MSASSDTAGLRSSLSYSLVFSFSFNTQTAYRIIPVVQNRHRLPTRTKHASQSNCHHVSVLSTFRRISQPCKPTVEAETLRISTWENEYESLLGTMYICAHRDGQGWTEVPRQTTSADRNLKLSMQEAKHQCVHVDLLCTTRRSRDSGCGLFILKVVRERCPHEHWGEIASLV